LPIETRLANVGWQWVWLIVLVRVVRGTMRVERAWWRMRRH